MSALRRPGTSFPRTPVKRSREVMPPNRSARSRGFGEGEDGTNGRPWCESTRQVSRFAPERQAWAKGGMGSANAGRAGANGRIPCAGAMGDNLNGKVWRHRNWPAGPAAELRRHGSGADGSLNSARKAVLALTAELIGGTGRHGGRACESSCDHGSGQ